MGICGITPTHCMFALVSKGLSLLWTEWRAMRSLPGGDRAGSCWRPWRDADVLVVSWLVGWLRVVDSRCGRFALVRRLSSSAGSLPWRSGMSVSYTLPASQTRPNAARHCFAPRWLARRQDSRRPAVWGKTALCEVPTYIYIYIYIYNIHKILIHTYSNVYQVWLKSLQEFQSYVCLVLSILLFSSPNSALTGDTEI
jgi:hypothetical protein